MAELTFNELMTAHMDAVRIKANVTGKLSIAEATEAINGIVINPPSPDVDVSGVTATASDVLNTVKFIDNTGTLKSGLIAIVTPSVTDNTFTVAKGYVPESTTLEVEEMTEPSLSANVVTIGKGYNKTQKTVTVPEATITNDGEKISISVGYNKTAQQFDIGGGIELPSGITVTPNSVLDGMYYIDANGTKQVGTMPNKGALYIQPEDSTIYLSSGYYSSITIASAPRLYRCAEYFPKATTIQVTHGLVILNDGTKVSLIGSYEYDGGYKWICPATQASGDYASYELYIQETYMVASGGSGAGYTMYSFILDKVNVGPMVNYGPNEYFIDGDAEFIPANGNVIAQDIVWSGNGIAFKDTFSGYEMTYNGRGSSPRYSQSDTLTTGLVATGYTPKIGAVYSSDTGLEVNRLYPESAGSAYDSTVEYGIVDAEGNFQAIDLSGDAPVDTGDAQTMQELIMFNTGHDEPEYPAAGGGSAIEFYECASYTPDADAYTKYYVTLADAPIAEANGTYVRTKWVDDETLQENMWDYYIVASTWKNENGYVLREDIGFEEYSYSIEDANGKTVYWLEYHTSQRLTNYSSDDWMDYATDDFTQLTFSAWQTQEMPATTESWSGYKVEQNKDTGVWITTDTLVENMQVLYQTPKVGEIYSADTSIRVKKMYHDANYIIPADGLVFFAPLATDYANLVNDEHAVIQGGQFTTYNGLRCVYLNGSEYIKWADDSNLPTGAESCSLFILVSPQAQSEWRTYISMGQEKRDHVNVSLGNGVFLEWGGTPLSVDGKWHSLCLVRNNQGEASAYIDGTFNASGTRDGILPTPSCMCVGANMESSYIQKVKSYVAYVAAYDRELSASEIVKIHNTLMEGVVQ